jgi:aspartate/methionine/tyrosine aminotransferase
MEAWEAPESEAAVESMVAQFRRRRDLLVEGLNRIPGIRCRTPQGAFYAFPNVEETGRGEQELARSLLDDAGVAVLAGTAFGEGGRGFVRLAYTQGEADIEQALERMDWYLSAKRRVVHAS